MNDTPAPYGYCPVCGGLGRSRERRPNGDDRCENGHVYPSSQALTTTLKAVSTKHDRLQERLTMIERANVDRWQDGYAAAERQIASWLDQPCGMSGHDDRWCPACSFRTDIANDIRDGKHRPMNWE